MRNFILRNKQFILLGIIILASILRLYKLNTIPPSLSWDEVSIGYNAYSILTTGRDEHGKWFPVGAFEAYGDYKPPGYIYATVPFVMLFGLNEWAVRLPSALSGILTVLITYWLTKIIFLTVEKKKHENENIELVALFSALFLALSPWHLNISRAGFEANLAMVCITTGLWFFLKSLQKKPVYLIISSLLLVFALYTFNSARIFVPLIAIAIGVLFRKQLRNTIKWVLISVSISILLLVPLIQHIRSPEGRLRFQEVNIFSDVSVIETANARINATGNMWWGKLLNNRRILFGREVARHYFDNLSMNFLFINGDGNPKFSIRDVGQLYIWDLVFLVAGMYFLIRNKEGVWYIIPIWLFLGIAPAAVARETPHALRTLNSLPMWQIITAYGFVYVSNKVIGSVHNRLKKSYVIGIVLLLMVNVIYYLHNYYFSYPKEFAGEWQWGYKQAIKIINQKSNDYDKIFITDKIGRAYMYTLFYSRFDPKQYWNTVDRGSDPYGFFNVYGFDKYVFLKSKLNSLPKTLYVVSPEEAPASAHVLHTILYPNGETALLVYD